MTQGTLGISLSGLAAAQRALATTSHNIANVNTEGYSRQRVDLTEQTPSYTGAGYQGNGVNIASITRAYDSLLNRQVRTNQSAASDLDSFYQLATQVDNVVADSSAGLAPSLQSFFDAVQGVANDPASVAARQVLLSQGETLASRFSTLNGRLDDLRDQINQNLAPTVSEINTLAKGIADLNGQIVAAGSNAGADPPNDLLDQRNLLVEKLSQQLDTTVYEQQDGSVNVSIGTGQSLVVGSVANPLKTQASAYDPRESDVALVSGSSSAVVTNILTGGKLGGELRFAREVLDPTQNALGNIAAGLAIAFNAQHHAGTDLSGNAGTDFFTDPTNPATGSVSTLARQSNTGSAQLAVAFDNSAGPPANGPAKLVASDYRMNYDGTNYTLTRLSDNQTYTSASGGFQVDGLNIAIASGSAAAGDSFLIRPARTMASDLKVALTDPGSIAAGGTPATGPGDNTNALALAGLQTTKSLLGGNASFGAAYDRIVGDVATRTQAADIDNTAQKKLLDQSVQQRDSVSGVNLDEEAANLLRFQQAYQASAQVITVVKATFDALIGAVR